MEGGLNKDEEERIFKQIEGLIKYHQKIFIFHHIRPDGDCLGSQFGLKELILTNFKGKKVKAIGDSKNQHSYLELKHDLRPTLEEIKNSLAIIVDSNYLERVEEADLIKSGLFKDIIRIDHHSNQDDLPGRVLRYVDPSFSACAEQVSYLAKELNWSFNPSSSTYLYLGIYTDSNRFLYPLVRPRTLTLASLLWESGANYRLIHTNLTRTNLRELSLRNFVTANAKTLGRVIYFKMDLAIQRKLDINSPLEAAKPNLLANIDGFPIWVFFTEEREGFYRVELRSIEAVSVKDVAIRFGGGGHKNASGTTARESELEEILKDCNQQIERDLGKELPSFSDNLFSDR